MTEPKTKSLSLATDPIARLRELHELDNPSPVPTIAKTLPHRSSETQPRSNLAVQQQSNAETPAPSNRSTQQPSGVETHKAANLDTSLYENTALSERDNPDTPQHSSPATLPRANLAAMTRGSAEMRQPRNEEPLITDNPVHEAMRQALRKPYAPDLQKGPSTATTIRIPTQIWERLDMASTLEAKTKQDLIAEALMQYLTKIGRGEL